MGLNKQKGNMFKFCTHTWNPIKGRCPHDCSYCLVARTKIMMGDYTIKNIEKVKVGDVVIGISKNNNKGFYRFTRTVVTNTSKRTANTLRFKTNDSEIACTPEHPLMGSTIKRCCTDWKQAKAFTPYESIRFIDNTDIDTYSREHFLGYIKGVRDGDGCVFEFKNKEKRKYKGFEIVITNRMLQGRVMKLFNDVLNIKLRTGIKRANKNSYGGDNPMLHTRITRFVDKLETETEYVSNIEFAKGYIAGMVDTDGSVSVSGCIRIAQSKKVNGVKYNYIIECCDLLGLKYVEEKDVIRILSNFNTRMRFLFEFGVFHSTKRDRLLLGKTVKGSSHSQIRSISANGHKIVYNLETECGNFIANGFIVHNCYMHRFWNMMKDDTLRLDEKELKTNLGESNFIFVGSSTDMWLSKTEWVSKILTHIAKYPKNTYLFQTKFPLGFDDWTFYDNQILGITLETNRPIDTISKAVSPVLRTIDFAGIEHTRKMITIEPIMNFDLLKFVNLIKMINPERVNIGADSGHNNLPEPSKEKILQLIAELEKFTKVIQKPNLKRIMIK